MQHKSTQQTALPLIFISGSLILAALLMLMATAWLSLLAPPASLLENWVLAQALACFSLSAFLGGRCLRAEAYAWAKVECLHQPARKYLYWQAGTILLGLIFCLLALGTQVEGTRFYQAALKRPGPVVRYD